VEAEDLWSWYVVLLDEVLFRYRCSSSSFCWGTLFKKSLRLLHFKSGRDEIWQDWSSHKSTSIDGVEFSIWRHTLNMAAMTSIHHSLPASPPRACDVTGSLNALQFLIRRTYFYWVRSFSQSDKSRSLRAKCSTFFFTGLYRYRLNLQYSRSI